MRQVYIILLLLLTLPLIAQDTDDIALDDIVTVTISEAHPTALTFMNDVEGQVITVTAKAIDAEQVDPVIWLTNPEDNLLAYNNNTIAADAQISNLVLATGQHTIYVDSFNGVTAGEVEITIAASDMFEMQVERSDDREIVRFYLPEDAVFSYPLTTTSGEAWTITAYDSNGNLDPALRILDSNGIIVAQNDDHQSANMGLNIFDSQIKDIVIMNDDTYSIEVTDFVGRSGEVTLEIQQKVSENP